MQRILSKRVLQGYPGKPASVSGTVFPGGTGHVYGGGYCGSCRDYYAGDEGERTCPSQRGRTVWRFCSADRKETAQITEKGVTLQRDFSWIFIWDSPRFVSIRQENR